MPKFIAKKLIHAFVLALLLMISIIPKTNVKAKTNGTGVEVVDDASINIFTPVAANATDIDLTTANNGPYVEFTLTPDNRATFPYIGYGNSNYVFSKSGKALMGSTLLNVTNGQPKSYANYVVFPFDVWDKATGKLYKAGTSIAFGTTYNSSGEANEPTTFVIPAFIGKGLNSTDPPRAYGYAMYSMAVNTADLRLVKMFRLSENKRSLTADPLVLAYMKNKSNDIKADSTSTRVAYDTGSIKIQPAVVKMEIISDSVKDEGELYMGESFAFKVYTSGNLTSDAHDVKLIPHYKWVSDLNAPTSSGKDVTLHTYIQSGENVKLIRQGSAFDTLDLTTFFFNQLPNIRNISPLSIAFTNKYMESNYDVNWSYKVSDPEEYKALYKDSHGTECDLNSVYAVRYGLSELRLGDSSRVFNLDAEYRTSYENLSGYVDVNGDDMDDRIQSSQAVWYGTFNIPSDVVIIDKDMKQGYCTTCNHTRWSSDGKCPTHRTSLVRVQNMDESYDEEDLQGLLFNEYNEFVEKDGYLDLSFDIIITDDEGYETKYEDVKPVYMNNLSEQVETRLRYNIAQKVGNKYYIVYSH